MDRKDGTGRGRRPDKKGGAGKGNTGLSEEVLYKKKQLPGEEGAEEEEKKEEVKKEEVPEEPKVTIKTEVIGVSMDDFFANRDRRQKAQARDAEGVKG